MITAIHWILGDIAVILNEFWWNTFPDSISFKWMVQGSLFYKSTLTHLPTNAACIRQQIGSALVQIMACRLFGTKPLSKPMPLPFQLELISVIFFIKIGTFSFTKMQLKISPAKIVILSRWRRGGGLVSSGIKPGPEPMLSRAHWGN